MNLEIKTFKIPNYSAPDHILNLNSFEKNQIGMNPFNLERYLPGFYDGKYMGDHESYIERLSRPEKDVIRGLLFLNCDSYQEMKDKVYQRIETMGKNFGIRKAFDFSADFPIEKSPFSTPEILDVLNFVEKTMEGQYRWTREPGFAHILRVVNRALDFISYNTRLYNSGLSFIPFTAETARGLILMSALHDFLEEKQILEDGSKVNLGDYFTKEVLTDEGIKDRLIFRRFGMPLNKDKTEFEIKEEVSFIMDCDHRGHFINGLEALRSEGDTEELEFIRLRKYFDKKLKETQLGPYRYLMWLYLPFLVRIFDRRDNLDTYFTGKNNSSKLNSVMSIAEGTDLFDFHFSPPDVKDLIAKAKGTLENIRFSEQILVMLLSPQNYRKGNLIDFLKLYGGALKTGIDARFKKIDLGFSQYYMPVLSGYFDENVLKFLPSRIAAFYLFGLTVNDIYKDNPWQVKMGAWTPEPI